MGLIWILLGLALLVWLALRGGAFDSFQASCAMSSASVMKTRQRCEHNGTRA